MLKQAIIEQLIVRKNDKKLNHAYLFFAINHEYALSCVFDFINLDYSNLNSTNVFIIDKKNEVIKKSDITKLLNEFSLKSFNQGYRYCVISDYSNITEEASNALLKFIEEPPKEVIIFLVASNKSNILPTILSRVVEYDVDFDVLEYYKVLEENINTTSFDLWILSRTTYSLNHALSFFKIENFLNLKSSILEFFNLKDKTSAVIYFLTYSKLDLDKELYFKLLILLTEEFIRQPLKFSNFNKLTINTLNNYLNILLKIEAKLKNNISFKNLLHELIINTF